MDSTDARSRSVLLNTGRVLQYDALVICSGSDVPSHLWPNSSLGEGEVERKIAEVNERVRKARTILIAGGGAVGVETAGELADMFAGKSRAAASEDHRKEITLLSGGEGLLSVIKI